MTMRMIYPILLIIALLNAGWCLAQTNDLAKARQLLANLQHKYASERALQFDVQYLYTNESKPDIVLDSIGGTIALQGDNYRFSIQNTLTVKNSRYIIHLFKDDKLMYVSKAGKTASPVDPIKMIDSLLAHVPGLQLQLEETNAHQLLTLLMPAGMTYKSIRFNIDEKTGYLHNLVYLIKTDQLVDPSLRNAEGKEAYDSYARVETRFANYTVANIDKAAFSEDSFFTRNGKKLEPVNDYKDYKIFLATPNL